MSIRRAFITYAGGVFNGMFLSGLWCATEDGRTAIGVLSVIGIVVVTGLLMMDEREEIG